MANSTFGTKTVYLVAFVDRDGREQGLRRLRRMRDDRVIDNSPRHYLGSTSDLERRIKRHLKGHGAAIIREAVRRGLNTRLVRLWVVPESDARRFERHLKTIDSPSHYCPLCAISRERVRLVKLALKLEICAPTRRRFIKQAITNSLKRIESARAQLSEANEINFLATGSEERTPEQIAAARLAGLSIRNEVNHVNARSGAA